MASIGHVAIGMAAGRLYARRDRDRKAIAFRMFALSAASLLPDADVISFELGIPYEAPFGHRGASHSIIAALLLGALAGLIGAWQAIDRTRARSRGARVGVLTALVVLTHGPLDAMTDGGRGVALLWPFDSERIFFPWTPIPVSPIGIHFLSREGLAVARFELLAFAPFFLYALWPRRVSGGG
ncbi:MAG: metal-dependent hydrolase [Labilithrix sp.]|nr:metal-dependent hydrolase [Labilithrix sp.]MCW5816174.1 metal-dependent hydrolase [Labilithrix sp.]